MEEESILKSIVSHGFVETIYFVQPKLCKSLIQCSYWKNQGMLNLLIQYFMFWRKLEYHYFIIGGVTIFYGMAAYRFTNDTPAVWRKELSSFCRMASWSILSKNISQIITYTTLYYIAEIYTKNQRYIAWKDSHFLHHSYKSSTDICWDRFIWVQSNSCFTVLHWKNKSKEKKVHQTIVRSWCTETDNLCCKDKTCAPIRHDTIDFSTYFYNKDISNPTIICCYSW